MIKEKLSYLSFTFLMKRVIYWGRMNNLSSLTLTARTTVDPFKNELSQRNLLAFYKKLGFYPIQKNSIFLKYIYEKNKGHFLREGNEFG